MVYARIISPIAIDTNPPKSAKIDGKMVIGTLPESYLNSIGYYRLESVPIPSESPEPGFHWEIRYGMDSNDNAVVQVWVQIADPVVEPVPRSLSKRKLYRALSMAGIWPQVKEYMEENGVWEDWEYATTLDEDDPLIVAAVQALQAGLGLTQEQVSGIIGASVAE